MKKLLLSATALALLSTSAALAKDEEKPGSIVLGLDAPYLMLNANHGGGGEGSGGNAWFDDGFDDQFAVRGTAAVRLHEELGVRGRFFHYDSDSGDDNGAPDRNLFFETTTWDVEGTAALELAKWDLVLSAGMRGARIKWSDEDGDQGYEFEGVGVSLGADLRRYLSDGLAIIAGVRHSQVFGEIDELNSADDNDENVVPITELRAGLEYSGLVSDCMVTIGLHYETTLFSSLSGNVDGDIDPEDVDVSLTGPSLVLRVAL